MSIATAKSPQQPAETCATGNTSSVGPFAHVDETASLQAAIYRSMSPAHRLAQAMRMFRQMQSLMDAGLRAEHPDWTEEHRRRVVAERILYARTG